MKVKSENYTPRERVNREMLDRMLAENAREESYERNSPPHFSATPYPSTPASACPCHDQRNYRRQNNERRTDCVKSPEYRSGRDTVDDYKCKSPVYPGVSLAMVYSPCQAFDDLYEAEVGMERGTIFKELDKPFMPTPCNERWCK